MSDTNVRFADLNLPEPLLRAVTEVGYESPSPIQAECIPLLLKGHDLLGQAQTGTGKTAAFALPLLARIDYARREPQLLVLAPTRELAIQVAEAMQSYAHFLPDFHVLPIYGGQSYEVQLRQLRRGVQVIVGTPGRVMDHMRKGSLKVDGLRALVLDEADEMLRMGFIDDVEWVLEHIPSERQIALFSATMPKEIRRVAEQHLRDPKLVKIKSKTTTAATIRQRYWVATGMHKLDALTRILETESLDGAIVFVRTKTATVELAEKLSARGFLAEPLSGDVPQAQREKTVERLKQGRIDILIATDVAARGLDVSRISHVINYDIPYDTESYVHRIGRTGRAGREGEAILFVAPRERRMLKAIERATGQAIEPMQLPSVSDVNSRRLERFKQRIVDVLGQDRDLAPFYQIVREIEDEHEVDPLQIAATVAALLQGDTPLLLRENPREKQSTAGLDERPERKPRERAPRNKVIETEPLPLKAHPDIEMERYRLEVGYRHGVKPGNIVGAIANEADIESQYIGHIEIFDHFTTIDLPSGMPKEIFNALKKTWVCQRQLQISRLGAGEAPTPATDKPRPKVRGGGDKRSAKRDASGGKGGHAPPRKNRQSAAKVRPAKPPRERLSIKPRGK
ncbi:MAG: DEAD/DEAH box helicase [Gammaproteobacteria bacterium]|nr:MAG: DEAD/DEAH box helicase [Gammaproteobacteria bacterium]